ncbi:MAG: sulfotransferase [bacterium]
MYVNIDSKQYEILKNFMRKPWRKLVFSMKKAKVELFSINAKVNPEPIFVLGNQKSGTSAIAALLASATGLSVSVDLSKEWLYKRKVYLLVKESQMSFSEFIERNKLDFSRDIIKEANLTIFFDELTQYFPKAKFVFVVRDPRTNIRSILNRVGVPGNLDSLTNWSQKPHIPLGWEKVINGKWLGLDGDNYISMLAQRWNFMTEIYLNNKENFVLTRYEDFVEDKVGEISRIANKLSLTPNYDISSKINIQYQPKGKNDVSIQSFYNKANLDRIEQTCHRHMKSIGYKHNIYS